VGTAAAEFFAAGRVTLACARTVHATEGGFRKSMEPAGIEPATSWLQSLSASARFSLFSRISGRKFADLAKMISEFRWCGDGEHVEKHVEPVTVHQLSLP